MHYLCSENKGADQLRGHHAAYLRLCFRICKKNRFSHEVAQIFLDMFHEVLWMAHFVRQQNVLNHFYNAWLVVLCSWQHVWACFLEFSPFFCFFLFSLTSFLRLFHSYREGPIGGWGETGVPRENHLTHPQAELGLSHMWPVRDSNLHQTQR